MPTLQHHALGIGSKRQSTAQTGSWQEMQQHVMCSNAETGSLPFLRLPDLVWPGRNRV